ncbi:MAG: tRNA pseudouridine(13) synthase TruD [Candidatus Woesearchaeota archaeon]
MVIIKEKPEDFFVKEISNIEIKNNGKHIVYVLKKENCSTHEAISKIKESLKLKNSEIGFSGSKDKRAITEQYITIKKKNSLARNFDFGNIKLEFLGYCEKRLLLGDLIGNNFKITLRDLNDEEIKNIEEIKSRDVLFLNYFGEQRFSLKNFEIGMLILKEDFENAIKKILSFRLNYDTINEYWGKKEFLLEKTSSHFDKKIIKHLIKNKNDFVGALKELPKELLMIYIHSVQSLIFNKTLSEIVYENLKNPFIIKYPFGNFYFAEQDELLKIADLKLPLVGFGLKEKYDFKEVVDKILKEYNIKPEDFIIRKIPEISSEGSFRNAVSKAENFSYSFFEENKKKNAVLEFSLKKGSYATVFLRQILKS